MNRRLLAALAHLPLAAACTSPEGPSAKDDGTPVPSPSDTGLADTATWPSSPPTGDTGTPSTATPVVREAKFDAAVPVLQAELDANLAEGVSIAVLEQGRFTWVEAFGTADPGADDPLTPDHLLQIGSTTKQITAALVLQQVEDGLYTVEDNVGAVIPQFALTASPDWAADATVHDLLSHQGALVDYIDPTNGPDDDLLASWYYGFFAENFWAMNPPGLFWNYSNPNFGLAGLIAEEHDPKGRPYPDLVVQELLAPLGMASTVARKVEAEATGRYALSTGLDLATGAIAEIPMAEVPDPAPDRPAGFLWSTPSDMCRWGRFLIAGDDAVLGQASRERVVTPHVPTRYFGDHHSYGYGEFVWDLYPLSDGFYPIRVWEHGGNTLSFTSVLVVLPDQDVVLSILSSGYGDVWTATTEAVLRAVVDPLPPVSAYTGEPFDPAEIGAHVGSYLDPFNVGPVEITAGGAYGLRIAMPAVEAAGYVVSPDLLPASTDLWYAEIDGYSYDLAFVRDPSGAPTFVRNRAFVATRSEVAPPRVQAPDPGRIAAALRRARAPGPVRLPPPRP